MPSRARKTASVLAAEENITVGLFEPFGPNPIAWRNRLHDKYLIVDGKYLVTGGRNINDKTFLPDGWDGQIVHDRDILIVCPDGGGAAEETARCADELWDSGYVKTVKGKADPERRAELLTLGAEAQAEHPELSGPVDDLDLIPVDRVDLVVNPLGRGRKDDAIWEHLTALMDETDGDIIMQSPYVILGADQLMTIGEMAKEVSIFTNSEKSAPNFPSFPHYLRQRPFLDDRAVLCEYVGEGSVHTKTFVIGPDITVVTSYNLDPRSRNLGAESAYVIHGEEFNQYMRDVYEKMQEECIRVEEGERTFPEGYGEGFGVKLKKVVLHTLSIILFPVKNLV